MNTTNPKIYASPLCDTSLVRSTGKLYLLDQISYSTAWQWQRKLVEAHKQDGMSKFGAVEEEPTDSLLLLQHPPVYTLGQGADPKFVRFDLESDACEIHRVERGGEVTYHCPGQLVGYPILNLKRYRMDLHWYLRQLEEVLIRTLACYGLSAERISGLTGVWLEGRKVAAIGIKVSRWITMHGFALNVCPDLSGFEKIVPCGIEGREVGAIAQFLPEIDFNDVRQRVIEQFEQVFGLKLAIAPISELTDLSSLQI